MSFVQPAYLLFGYVELRAENGFAERFINLCTADGIPLWDIRKHGQTITAKTTASGYKKIRTPARKSSMQVQITKKHGLPFLLNKLTAHTGIVIGIAVTAVVLSFLSCRIWIIEIDNKTDIPDKEIIEAYEASGLKLGTNRRSNFESMSLSVSQLIDDASWTAVTVIGSTATIKVRQTQNTSPPETSDKSANIIASKDGQVEIIEPYRGTPVVKAGHTVTKGDLLVSGVTESRIQSYLFSHAEGYVAARTKINVKKQQTLAEIALTPKPHKVFYLCFLGKEIPLGIARKAECCYVHRAWLHIGGKQLPFGIHYRLFTNYEDKKDTLSKQEATLTALNDYSLIAYNSTLHTQPISQSVSIKNYGNKIIVSGEYSCFENIGEKILLDVEEIATEFPETAQE